MKSHIFSESDPEKKSKSTHDTFFNGLLATRFFLQCVFDNEKCRNSLDCLVSDAPADFIAPTPEEEETPDVKRRGSFEDAEQTNRRGSIEDNIAKQEQANELSGLLDSLGIQDDESDSDEDEDMDQLLGKFGLDLN